MNFSKAISNPVWSVLERLAQLPAMEIQAALWCAQMETEIPNWQELFPLAKTAAPVPESIPEFLNTKNGLVKELLFKNTK